MQPAAVRPAAVHPIARSKVAPHSHHLSCNSPELTLGRASASVDSLAAIDRVFDLCHTHGLRVLLELHGAPGSQNGADHSGCDDEGIGWGEGSSVERTLSALSILTSRYGSHPSLLGFEFLNEPAWKVHRRPIGGAFDL